MVTIHRLSQNTTQSKRRGFSQLKVNLDYSSEEQQDGKDKLVKSSTLIGSLMPRELKEAQEMMIFTLELLTQVTQAVTSKDCQLGNPFEISKSEFKTPLSVDRFSKALRELNLGFQLKLTVGLRWVPTGKIFTPSTTKVDTQMVQMQISLSKYESAQISDGQCERASRNSNLMNKSNDVCSQQFRPQSSMSNDVCSQQFRPQSSMSNDVCSQQFRPQSSMSNDVCSQQFRPQTSMSNGVRSRQF
ncbi:hypothetical protein Tco_0729416 [Tanacetum coccineum]|uniref:Uncharacterized protein n=1 Tax=Tanacetum coccineum TaxID=301880 RepID=A0ABQ4YPT6_9ASTR